MYVLDTNVFIDAANAYYAFDLAPGYWDFLVQLFNSHHAVSIKSVRRATVILSRTGRSRIDNTLLLPTRAWWPAISRS